MKKTIQPSSIMIEEGSLARVDYSDLVVQINKKISLPKERDKWNRVSVIASMPVDGVAIPLTGEEVILSQAMLDGKVSEISELPKFDTSVLLFNGTDFDAMFVAAKEYGDTIVMLSDATQKYLVIENKPDWKGILWLTNASTTVSEELKLFASKNSQGVMQDSTKEGKLLYALLTMLSNNDRVVNTHQIINNTMRGILTIPEANALADDGISYWFASRQQVFPDGFFLGKKQAFVMYYDRLITARAKEAVARIVQSGITMTLGNMALFQHALDNIGMQFANQLNPDVTDFRVNDLALLSEADILEGRIYLYMDYRVNGEVRRVSIEVGGE